MFACLRHPDPEGRLRWLVAESPRGVLRTRDPREVPALLAEVEAATVEGAYAVGFLTYEAARAFDPAFQTHAPGALPCLCFALYDELSWCDRPPAPEGLFEAGPWAGDWEETSHANAVRAVRDWIARGHTYQINLTHRLRAPFRGDPLAFFHALHREQPTPFAAYLATDAWCVASVSPELFFERNGCAVTTRPMKGTRPRGRWPAEDVDLRGALLASPKERAENAMIVDMIRNDLGRVARPGSVRVASCFDVEGYRSVWQLTSTVTADVEARLPDLLGSLFPCASVTGAPKIRTMEIIHDLELSPRGIYTGCIGTVGPGGRARFSVAIRTADIDRTRGTATYGTGGGIVWDSEPESEWRECMLKARVLRFGWPDFALLETIRWTPARGFFLLEGHLCRMGTSAARLGYPFPTATIRGRLAEVAAGFPSVPMRVRLLLDAEGAITVEASRLGARRPRTIRRLALATEPVDPDSLFLYHKTTQRAVYEQARAEHPDADDVILVNPNGHLTETTIATLVLRLNGRLVTPPVSDGLLGGVFREELLRRGRVQEQSLTLADLRRAEGVWCVNSLRGWMPAEVRGEPPAGAPTP